MKKTLLIFIAAVGLISCTISVNKTTQMANCEIEELLHKWQLNEASLANLDTSKNEIVAFDLLDDSSAQITIVRDNKTEIIKGRWHWHYRKQLNNKIMNFSIQSDLALRYKLKNCTNILSLSLGRRNNVLIIKEGGNKIFEDQIFAQY